MLEFAAVALMVSFFAEFTTIVLYLLALRRFFESLRIDARGKWLELGSPTFSPGISSETLWSASGYALKGDLSELPAASAGIAHRVRTLYRVGLWTGIAVIGFGLAFSMLLRQ